MISLRDRIISLAARPDAEWWLWLMAVAEGFKYPALLEVLLPRMVALRVEKAWRYAFVAAVGSVIGALLAYLLGWLLWLTLGQGAAMVLGLEDAHGQAVNVLNAYDVPLILAAGLSPLPFKWVAMLFGFLEGNVIQFAVGALIARGARFWLISWLVWRHGPRTLVWLEKNLYPLTMLLALGLMFVLGLIKLWAM